MRVSVSMLLALGAFGVSGCGEDPPCVNEDGDEVSFCEVEVPGEEEPLIYCPGDQWASTDGCFSYGCSNNGEVQPTQDLCAQQQ